MSDTPTTDIQVSASEELSDAFRQDVRELFNKMQTAAGKAVSFQQVSIVLGYEAGYKLNVAKRRIRHGEWGKWLTDTIQAEHDSGPYRTATKVMSFANSIDKDWNGDVHKFLAHEDPHSLRKAMICCGIIKEPARKVDQTAAKPPAELPYMAAAAKFRESMAIRREESPVHEWPREEREAIVSHWEPVADILDEIRKSLSA